MAIDLGGDRSVFVFVRCARVGGKYASAVVGGVER